MEELRKHGNLGLEAGRRDLEDHRGMSLSLIADSLFVFTADMERCVARILHAGSGTRTGRLLRKEDQPGGV